MDEKGLVFTLDAVLALIPVFIIIAAVANVGDSGSASNQNRYIQDAQDTLEIMTAQNSLNSNVLQNIASILALNNNSEAGIQEAGKIAGSYLNKTLGNSNYSLMEVSELNKTIAFRGDIKKANDVSVGFKSCGKYIFKLYVWK
ncbi:MAG: hypothetical protein PQ964_05520 [Methanobacteriaceae archaeon]|jgi:hypothetical protein